ncbi:MAG: hypothetical protein PHE17_13135 [Thiothrix sp.]|uniref:hypothetical protein n=1 Tax=Thiothrix sp. TaxID=1032 RepID=UPI00260CC6F1|nr:hypothetical protein [Thiothrix sp.]MDD5393957.1 hypothetical protein [Thiothrix sp.]
MVAEQMMAKKPIKRFLKKWLITFKVMPIIILVTIAKFLAHQFELEVMDLNALFTSLVAGTIFLIGFLIAGVLSDYKESEKIPSELSASMKTLLDDTYTICKIKPLAAASQFMEYQQSFSSVLLDWFHKKEETQEILKKISNMNDFFVLFDQEGIQANYIIKLKNEQNNLRRMVLRIDTIRNTNFVGSAYAIVETMGFMIACGLISIKITPFYMSLFFTLLITFLVFYMILLIKDLDNPFDYSDGIQIGTEISLKPLYEHLASFERGM